MGDRITVDVTRCAACERDHDALDFARIENPIDEWTHQGTCPTNGVQVLLRLFADEPRA